MIYNTSQLADDSLNLATKQTFNYKASALDFESGRDP